jgi:hypothetical protein
MADEDELDAPAHGRRIVVTTGIPQTSLTVRIYGPSKRSESGWVSLDADEGAVCSVASPGGTIRRSPSSPAANVNDPKVNSMPRGNLTSNVQGAIAFPDGSWAQPPTWRASVDVVSSDILSRNGKSVTMQDQSQGRTRRVFRLVQALRRVKTLHPVLLYYEV